MNFLALIQVGYQKAGSRHRPGQLVKAYICFSSGGEEEIQWSNDPEQGSYLTDRSHRDMCWYLAKRQLSDRDLIRFEIFSGIRGQGEDPNLTQKRLYQFDENAPVREFSVSHVGFRKFPLLKGRFHEIQNVSKRDEIEMELSSLVGDEEKM